MLLSLLQSLSTNILYFMLHLSSTNSFPKPLSAKEEQEELIKLRKSHNSLNNTDSNECEVLNKYLNIALVEK